ncbi:MAG: metallophosphoesterase family protein [Sphingomonas sp.]
MLNRILKSLRAPQAPQACVPPGIRIYAIGDIHGRLDLLDKLLVRIEQDDLARGQSATQLIFLGDLVDRGPDSAGVVERLRRLAETNVNMRFLLGNHEETFLRAIEGNTKALKFFCRYGGRETILSYGIPPDEYDRLDYDDLAARLAPLVPSSHRDFLGRFEDLITIGDYAFVHAGVRPDMPFDSQTVHDLRWIREPFLGHRGMLDKVVVHGHTISEQVEILPHRIGIDTGAYMSGVLSALGLERDDRWILST